MPRILLLFLAFLAFCMAPAYADSPPSDGFNKYVLKAAEKIYKEHASQGYDINSFYTHNISYGDGTLKSNNTPYTMCVAAVAEIIAEAIKLYVDETGDKTPMSYLPASSFNRMRPTDLRSHIWVDHRLDSFGTADALVTFGIGKRVKFAELTPGSFVNINRTTKSGHAVMFVGFIDKAGNVLDTYSDQVKGFKYFSAQGKANKGDAGFAYRYAFFTKGKDAFCPDLTDGKRRDCNVIWSTGQKLLNTGYMLHPKYWDAKTRDANFQALIEGLYQQTRSRGDDFLGIDDDLSLEQFTVALQENDTMKLNDVFEFDATTDDD